MCLSLLKSLSFCFSNTLFENFGTPTEAWLLDPPSPNMIQEVTLHVYHLSFSATFFDFLLSVSLAHPIIRQAVFPIWLHGL